MVNWLRLKLRNWLDLSTGSGWETLNPKPKSGVSVNQDTALNFSAVFRATSIISQTLAGLPVEVVKGQGEESERVPGHRLERIFNLSFNRLEGSFTARERLQASVLLDNKGTGFAQILKERSSGAVLGLHVLHPSRVKPKWVRGDGGVDRVYVLDGDEENPLRDEEVFCIPSFGYDGLTAKSIVTLARESIGHGLALEQYGASNFASPTPRGVLKTSKTVDPDDKEKMRVSWRATHQDASDIAILDEDFTFDPINVNNDDRQFLQSRAFQVVEIARWFGVPPHMLAELDKSNYNTTERLGDEFKTLTLQPWVIRWEQEATRKLLLPSEVEQGYSVQLNMNELLRADLKTRVSAESEAVSKGIKTLNEARAALKLPRSKDPRADELLIPLNMGLPDDATNETDEALPAEDGSPQRGDANNRGTSDTVQRGSRVSSGS